MTFASPQFHEEDGVLIPHRRPRHRDDDYDEIGFDVLLRMQREHFWYRGRHRLLCNVLKKEIKQHRKQALGLSAIDLGGGCGGWLEYLHAEEKSMFQTLALGDSSKRALTLAKPVVGPFACRYQIDLLDLPWCDEWDVVFLLDVIEHIADDREVLRQARASLRPGGLVMVTTPALELFWTYNDDLAQHKRRYCTEDFQRLGELVGLKLVRTDYFMFFLSPALLLSRLLFRPRKNASPEELRGYLERTHRIPSWPVNKLMGKIFSLEASIVNRVQFPWGTSILALFER